jgi:hypothetical protein
MISPQLRGPRPVDLGRRDERHPPRARVHTVSSDVIFQHLFSYIVVQQPAGHDRPFFRAVVVAFIRFGVRVVVEQGRLGFVVVGLLRRGGRLALGS